MSQQCDVVTGSSTKEYSSIGTDVVVLLYSALICPHLDYYVQFWALQFKRDIGKLEPVQRRAARVVRVLVLLSYEDRLKKLHMFHWENRMIKRGHIYKYLRDCHVEDGSDLFSVPPEGRTRTNGIKLNFD